VSAVADQQQPGTRARRGKSGSVTVAELPVTDYDRWAAFVHEAPGGSTYSLPRYLEALCDAGGGTYRVLAALKGDEILGGVALYERGSRLGTFVAPRLLLYYNGFVLRSYTTKYPSERAARQLEVVAALAAALEQRGYGRLELKSRSPFQDARPLLDRGWEVRPTYTYVVDIRDLETAWSRVDQNLRRLVERAKSGGLVVTVDDDDADSLYGLHRLTAERKGAPLYLPVDAFGRFHAALRERGLCRVYNARLADGRVAASQLVLLGHRVTHTVIAAADGELQQTGANPFLRWSVFESLAGDGFVANDLTDAALGPVARFKSQLGGELETTLVVGRLAARFRVRRSGRALLSRAKRTVVRASKR
jgi:hypothetical protein